MISNIEKITNFFLEKKGYFFLARLSLKVGKDLVKISPQETQDPELLEKIKRAAGELGVSGEELNKIINSAGVLA